MPEVTALHDQSMVLAQDADQARRRGDHALAATLYAQALDLERRAAEGESTQPSRSILFRSAAWLALESGDAAEAERLAAWGLTAREAPERVKNELREVAEEARLRLCEPLPPPSATSSLTMHMDGPAIGYGGAEPAEVMGRIEALHAMLTRTAERQAALIFRRRGPPSAMLREQLRPRVQWAPGSVVVQITLGGEDPELWDRNAALIAELCLCIDIAASGDEAALGERIADETYRENFAALVARLSPDGERVTAVDLLGATASGALPVVRLRRRASSLRRSPGGVAADTRELVGELRAADGVARRSSIQVVLDDGTPIKITVSDAVLSDIVRPYYGERVRLTVRRGKRGWWEMQGLPELAGA